MSGIQKGLPNLIISIYKESIWIYRNRAIFQAPAKEKMIFDRIENGQFLHKPPDINNSEADCHKKVLSVHMLK